MSRKPCDMIDEIPVCEKCKIPARLLKSSKPIYGKDYGPVWVCGNFPECDARCGCHPGTDNPLGTLADKETRKLREKVHAAFDPMWKRHAKKKQARRAAYNLLADAMRIDVHECHVGMFNALRCKAALDCIGRIKAELEAVS